MKNSGILLTAKLLTYAFILTFCSSCTETNYKGVDKLLLIEFSTVKVDSAYLTKGFSKAKSVNDSAFVADSLNKRNLTDSTTISLKELDKLEDIVTNGIVLKPPKKYRYPPTKTIIADQLHQRYRDFEKAVLEGKSKLKLIDTSKHYISNGRLY